MSDRNQSRCWLGAALLILVLTLAGITGAAHADSGPVVRMVYFTANDCPHCATVVDEVLNPLQAEYGAQMQIKVVEISDL